jgi:hypothetical protein
MSELRDLTFIEAHTGPAATEDRERRTYGCGCKAHRKPFWALGQYRWATEACREGHRDNP